MWNRLLISLLLLLGSQALFSQTWLNKTDKDILLYISENKERIEDSKQTDTLFTLTCQEEDELGRLFEVSYRFVTGSETINSTAKGSAAFNI